MKKELDSILNEINTKFRNDITYKSVSSILNENYKDDDDYIEYENEYANYDLSDVFIETKIERLFDLGIIDLDKKQELLDIFHEYREIYDYEPNSDKGYLLQTKLAVYGLLEPINLKNAFINEIDEELKAKQKRK